MATHEEQHFAPVFLLKHWHTPPDNKLSCFRWINGRLHHERYKAKSVAKQAGLYALEGVSDDLRNAIERDFMGPKVDTPAAVAHRLILSEGTKALTRSQRTDWSRFLVSLLIRTPDMIERVRETGRETLRSGLNERPEEYERLRGNSAAETLLEWADKNMPHVFTNFGVTSLPGLVQSELLNTTLLGSTWGLLRVDDCKHDLLIGDRPLVYVGKMKTRYLVALPISPRRLFVSFNASETLRRITSETPAGIVKKVNETTVGRSVRYVYATSPAQRSFIESRLANPGKEKR